MGVITAADPAAWRDRQGAIAPARQLARLTAAALSNGFLVCPHCSR